MQVNKTARPDDDQAGVRPNRFKRFAAGLMLFLMGHWVFAQSFAPGQCQPIPNSQACVDSTPCKTDSLGHTVCLSGIAAPAGASSLSQSCWQYSYQYSCAAPGTNTCTPYQSDPSCTMVKSNCLSTSVLTGICQSWDYTYSCQTGKGSSSPTVACTNGLFDTSGFATPTTTNNTFPTAAIASEMMREAQTYNQDGKAIFMGVKEQCDNAYFGIKHCCTSTPGAMSNADAAATMEGQVMSSGVKFLAQPAVSQMSIYMYDAMYEVGWWMSEFSMEMGMYMMDTAAASSAAATAAASFGSSFSAMGFTYQSAGTFQAAQSANVVSQGSVQVASFDGGGFVAFDPTTFAIMVAVMVIMSAAQCSKDELMLSMHRGANLSYFLEKHCNGSFLGACQGETQTYCSFNSVLAKIINTQGKPQLGLDVTDCSGLTVDQITQIDFTKIDFSEFTSTVSAQATKGMPSSSAINSAYTGQVNSTQKTNTQTGSNIVYPAYPPPGP